MRHDRGVALILVLSILTVAGIMAISFAFTMQLELRSASNFIEAARASYLAEAGVKHAEAVLKEDSRDIDTFEDAWNTVFKGSDVDNDGDGQADSKWIYLYDEKGNAIGRYAVLIRDEAGFLPVNFATGYNKSPLKITEGWTPYELDLEGFLGSFGITNPKKIAEDILGYKYGPDGLPGVAGMDDNYNQRVFGSDGIDNNGDGIIDEAGEGIDEPMEFSSERPCGDDNPFDTPFEVAKIKSLGEKNFKEIYPYITSYSSNNNLDIEGRLRENINFIDPASLLVLFMDSGISDPFQKVVNIIDACDEDFCQTRISKVSNRLVSINRGPIGDWIWRSDHYESDVKDGDPLLMTWINLPEGEYYIGVFGVQDEFVGDVTINGITQHDVKHGEILRIGPISFENRILNLEIRNTRDNTVCYFSYLELYPRLGQENFSTVEIRGVEGIRINEIMVKPAISRSTFSGQKPGGDWVWQNGYYENNEPGGGRAGAGVWTWKDIPDGNYYVRMFSGVKGQEIGDVEINGTYSKSVMDGELFGGGKVVTISGNKLTITIQNNRSSGSTYFGSVQLTQEPDLEYVEIVNITPREVNLSGWSLDGPSKEGWPASIPLGTVIKPYEHMVLCVDKDDSQSGVNSNGISFLSRWGKDKKAATLHFVRSIRPGSDLFSNASEPGGNIVTLKDDMGHIVDQEEYFSSNIIDNKSLEKSDPTHVIDSNFNGVPDNWYISNAKDGATPGLPNNNDGMKEKINDEIIEHSITELTVKNKNFSSVGEMVFVSTGLKAWRFVSLEDVSKVADRLTVFGHRLEAEGHIVSGQEGGWRLVQRASPLTDCYESGKLNSIGMWRWEEKDGLKNGYYTLRIFGQEEEEIAVSLHLSDDTWTDFTPSLSPGPDGSIFFGNIEIGTGSSLSTPPGMLELKIKNVSKTGAAHFDFIRLDPVNYIDGRININTASKRVLTAMPGIDELIADNIIKNRPYGNKNNLRLGIGDIATGNILGSTELERKQRFKKISNLIVIHSDIYRIIVTSQTLDGSRVLSEKKLWVVFER